MYYIAEDKQSQAQSSDIADENQETEQTQDVRTFNIFCDFKNQSTSLEVCARTKKIIPIKCITLYSSSPPPHTNKPKLIREHKSP